MQVTVREGEDVLLHDLEVGSTGTDLFPKQTGMVAAVVNGVSVDLATELHEGDQIGGVHISSAVMHRCGKFFFRNNTSAPKDLERRTGNMPD